MAKSNEKKKLINNHIKYQSPDDNSLNKLQITVEPTIQLNNTTNLWLLIHTFRVIDALGKVISMVKKVIDQTLTLRTTTNTRGRLFTFTDVGQRLRDYFLFV